MYDERVFSEWQLWISEPLQRFRRAPKQRPRLRKSDSRLVQGPRLPMRFRRQRSRCQRMSHQLRCSLQKERSDRATVTGNWSSTNFDGQRQLPSEVRVTTPRSTSDFLILLKTSRNAFVWFTIDLSIEQHVTPRKIQNSTCVQIWVVLLGSPQRSFRRKLPKLWQLRYCNLCNWPKFLFVPKLRFRTYWNFQGFFYADVTATKTRENQQEELKKEKQTSGTTRIN